jgi:hypothetical protein
LKKKTNISIKLGISNTIFFILFILNKTCLIIDDSFGYELLTLTPAMSAEEPIEMSPIGPSELGDAISRRARRIRFQQKMCLNIIQIILLRHWRNIIYNSLCFLF